MIDLIQCARSIDAKEQVGEPRTEVTGCSVHTGKRGAKTMTINTDSMRGLYTVLGCGLILGLVGCDYWPPALQAQIEQMRSETQTLTMEKTQLQAQVSDLSKAKQEVQRQMDDLSRMNREKTAMIMSLQKQLDGVRAQALKSMSSKTAQRNAHVKSPSKPAPKTPSTKKPVSKGVGVR